MNTIKTVFLAALLSAAAYGVYVGVTGEPPNFGRRHKHRDWEESADSDTGDESGLSAPLVSVDEGAPSIGGMELPQTGGAPPADVGAPLGTELATSQTQPLTGETPTDKFISNQRYPSARAEHDPRSFDGSPVAGADIAPAEHPPIAETLGGQMPLQYDQAHAQIAHDPSVFATLMQSVESLLAQNQLADAHLELSEWFGDQHFSPAEDAHVTELLDRLAGTVIYSRQHLLERPYEVHPGDTLDKIADAYEVPWELLANINGIRDPRAVRPGDQLKVVKGPFDAYVNLSKLQLVLYLGNRYAGRFQIGMGKDIDIPEGKFVVHQKITNPTYYGQSVIDKDDPNNPLGDYAIDLGDKILIHGTNDPRSIGRVDSRGCIRLAERDIKDVSEILTAKSDRSSGSLVQIKRY